MTTNVLGLKMIQVDSIGTDMRLALVGGKMIEVNCVQYPESEGGLYIRGMRRSAKITLRKAAEMLGISAYDLSGIEYGRLTLSFDDWQKLCRFYEGLQS